jgi:hypothetical protein
MHKALLIRDAIISKVQALVGTGVIKKVVFGAEPSNDHPSVSVLLAADTPQSFNSAFTDWELTIYTDISIRTKSADVDAEMLAVRLAVHQSIMSEDTQGLSFVSQTLPLGQEDPNRSDESDQNMSATRLSWQVTYRANTRDPSL